MAHIPCSSFEILGRSLIVDRYQALNTQTCIYNNPNQILLKKNFLDAMKTLNTTSKVSSECNPIINLRIIVVLNPVTV